MIVQTKVPAPGQEQAPNIKTLSIDPSTQPGMVLQALRKRPMSTAELQWSLPIADARSAVRHLRNKGITIETRDHPNPSSGSRCKTIQRYHLVEAPE